LGFYPSFTESSEPDVRTDIERRGLIVAYSTVCLFLWKPKSPSVSDPG